MKLRLTVATAGLLIAAQYAGAHEYSALIKARKYEEAERAINARLAQEPANAAALTAKVELILENGPDGRIEEAVKLGEQCVLAHPQQSECHETHGNALGAKAMHAGIMSAMGYAGTIRDEFKKAIELDPQNLGARFSLLQFYIQAPGIIGGGTGKAKTLAAETATVNAEASKLMLAQLDIEDEKFARAESAALAVRPGSSEALADNQRDVLLGLASHFLREKKYVDSDRIYHEVQKQFPDTEWAPYGIARVLQEQGKNQDAIALFEKALTLAPRAPIYYRIGQCLQALNEKAKAVTAYEKALSFKAGLPDKYKSDMEQRLRTLKG